MAVFSSFIFHIPFYRAFNQKVTCKLIVLDVIFMGLPMFIFREQRQKEANKMAVNSFPKDRDYRREVMQATATSGFASGSKY